MAFFEDLSRTVTEAGQKTIAKTKEIADVAKLNTMISENEKVITNQYYQIGKLYVLLHKENFEEDFAGMMTAVADAEAKIKDYKKQIQDIKGVRRCEKCGAEVPNSSVFCSSCGAAMPKQQTAASDDCIKCQSCGAEVEKGSRFCTFCGKPMEVAGTPAAKPKAKICPKCGAKAEGNSIFCTECGTKL